MAAFSRESYYTTVVKLRAYANQIHDFYNSYKAALSAERNQSISVIVLCRIYLASILFMAPLTTLRTSRDAAHCLTKTWIR